MTTKIVLAGAASQVGYRLLPLLEAAGFSTLAISRNGMPGWAQPVAGTDWSTPEAMQSQGSSAAVLVSAGPLALVPAIASEMGTVKQIVALSSASVQFKSDSDDPLEKQLMAGLLAAEEQLEQACKYRSIALTILRPTLIYGSGLDENLCRLARWIRRIGWLPVAGAGAGLRQPIYSGDLAKLILEAVMTPAGRAGIFPVAGTGRVSYHGMLIAVFNALDKKPRIIRIPVPILRQLLRLYAVLRPGTGISALMADRQNRDLLVNTDKMHAAFSFKPGEFRLRKEHLLRP